MQAAPLNETEGRPQDIWCVWAVRQCIGPWPTPRPVQTFAMPPCQQVVKEKAGCCSLSILPIKGAAKNGKRDAIGSVWGHRSPGVRRKMDRAAGALHFYNSHRIDQDANSAGNI